MEFFRKNKPLQLVCEMGGGSAGIAIVDNSNTIPKVLFMRRIFLEDIKEEEKSLHSKNCDRLLSIILDEVLNDAFKSKAINSFGKFYLEKVIVVFNTPLYISETRHINEKRGEPFLVSDKLIANLAEREEENFRSEIAKSDQKNLSEGVEILEREASGFLLNGYETLNPMMKKTSEIDFSFYLSGAPVSVTKSVKIQFEKKLHAKEVVFRTFSGILRNTVRDLFKGEENLVFVHVSANSTDLVKVSKSKLDYAESLSSGYGSFVKLISSKYGISLDLALSMFRIYCSGFADKATNETIEILINEELNLWRENLLKSYSLHKPTLVKKWILICDKDFFPIFKKTIATIDKSEKIFYMDLSNFKEKIIFSSQMPFDSSLATLVLGSGKI